MSGSQALALLLHHPALGRALGQHFSNLPVPTGFLQILSQCRFWLQKPEQSLRCCISNYVAPRRYRWPACCWTTRWVARLLTSGSQIGEVLPPRDICNVRRHFFIVTTRNGDDTGPCGQRSVMLLNILQSTGQPSNQSKELFGPECPQWYN